MGLQESEQGDIWRRRWVCGVIAKDCHADPSKLTRLLDEKNIPYMFASSEKELGAAASTTTGSTSCVLIRTPKEAFDGQKLYETMMKEANAYKRQRAEAGTVPSAPSQRAHVDEKGRPQLPRSMMNAESVDNIVAAPIRLSSNLD